jgi:hypothetical protein
MPPKGYEPNYRLITEEELRQIIKDMEAELKDRGDKLFEQLKGNIIKALEEMKESFPESKVLVGHPYKDVVIDVLNNVDYIAFER